MKRTLLLPALALAAMVSSAYAAPCEGYYCKWAKGYGATGCNQITSTDNVGDPPAPATSCDVTVENCRNYGYLFSDAACSAGNQLNEDKKPQDATSLGCCKWAEDNPTGKCWDIWNNEADATTQVTDCQGGDNQFFTGACPDTQGTCPNSTNPSSSSGANPSSSSGEADPPPVTAGTGYKIFGYEGKDAANAPIVYGGYVAAYTYNGATLGNIDNPHSAGDYLGVLEGVAKLYNITLAAPTEYSGAAIGFDNNTAATGEKIADCQKISYYYKGDPHWFNLEFPKSLCADPTKADDNKWGLEVTPAKTEWTLKEVTLGDLKLARTWTGAGCGGATGDVNAVPVDLTKVEKVSWVIDDNVSGTKKNLMIADVVCLTATGDAVSHNPPPSDITFASGWAGSSNSGNSSSSGTTEGGSSSSGATDGGNSSSSGDGTPIISLSLKAQTNSLSAMSNGINLAVAKSAVVKVYDLKGNAVSSYRFAQGSYNISFSDLPRGLYIVKASGASWSKTITVPVK